MKTFRHLLLAACVLASSPAFAQSGVEGLLVPSGPGGQVAPSQYQPVQAGVPAPVQQSGTSSGKSERDDAFERALKEASPLTPGQIQTYRSTIDRAQRANSMPLTSSRPVSRSIRLSLKPGERTPELRVQPGVVSTMTFSDVTGAPWPVLSVVSGNPQAFIAQSAGEPGKSNIIVLSAVQAYTPSNLVVTLVNYPVPVTMALVPGEHETDFRVDVQVAARGPNAVMDMVGTSGLTPTDDSTMLMFLDGTPPAGAAKMRTTSSDVEAWRLEEKLYVRTPGDLLSPAYVSRSSNVSGVHVFSLNDTPVLIVSRDGRMSSVRINR